MIPLPQFIQTLRRPHEVQILGLCGQAGAGKSNFVTPHITAAAASQGVETAVLGLDAFFILSSHERKAWLAEDGIDETERQRRRNQINWWDFGKAEDAIRTLHQGLPLHLTGVYNRRDSGELTGELHIVPPPEGMVVVLEGVAVAHLPVDATLFVHAPNDVRYHRLFLRDATRRPDLTAAQARFELTNDFERWYFDLHWHLVHHVVLNAHDINGNEPDMLVHPATNFGWRELLEA